MTMLTLKKKKIGCQLFLQEKKKKLVSFRIGRKFPFGVWNHGEPGASPTWRGKENAFIEGKRIWESHSTQRVHGFRWLSSCQERRGVFLLPVGPCCPPRAGELPESGLLTLFNWGFCLLIFLQLFVIFYNFYNWKQNLFLWSLSYFLTLCLSFWVIWEP